MPTVLNLRKRDQKTENDIRSSKSPQKTIVQPVIEKKIQVTNSPPPPADQTAPEISWQAPSFNYNPQKKILWLVVSALAIGGVTLLILRMDTLTAIFLLLSSLVLTLHSTKKPEPSRVALTQRGLAINEMMYYYRDLKSFWIHYNPGDTKELSLESKKWYMPYIKVSIEKENPLSIRSFIVRFLPEREHEQSLSDIISRKIGL